MLDRRTFVAALPLLGLAARAADPARELLDQAIARAGGRAALTAARILSWTGTAIVHAEGRTVRIGVKTRVEPFVRARSDSWILEQGQQATRSMILEPSEAWVERRGMRTPMPAPMATHERAQFSIYGLMRLVDLTAPEVRLTRRGKALHVTHPSAPETLLMFDETARLTGAENAPPGPDDGALVPQRFRFAGRMPGPIAWPRTIRIDQRGQPYFELTLTSFSTA